MLNSFCLFLFCRDLSVNRISQLSDYAFAHLTHLQQLKLGSNLLETLPPFVFYNLENLTILTLQENRFHIIPVEAFMHLHSLRHLQLNDNQIQTIPGNSFQNMTSLTTLWLSKNNITSLPLEAINRLHSLVDLSFAKNHIKEVPPFAFTNLTRIHYFSLARNYIQEVPDFAFSDLDNLKKLFLHHNEIRTVGNMAFANLKSLDHLDLSENRLPDVPKAIEQLPNLEKLQLKSNNISFIPDFIFRKNTRLIDLELKGNYIRSFSHQAFSGIPMLERLVISEADMQKVFPDLTGSHKLAIIQFDRAGIETLPPDLCQKVPTLQSLDVHSNKISKMPNLTGCGELRILNVCNNKITEIQLDLFRGLSKLRDLIMGNNFITEIPDGAFTGLERLENLDLVDNRISYIAENAFKPLNNLRELNLGENQFSHLPTDGLMKLKKLLIYKNKYLQNFPSSSAFPEIQFLTLTYSYHCCKFITTTEPVKEKPLEFTEEIFWLNKKDSNWEHHKNITDIWKPVVNGSIDLYDIAQDILDRKFNSKYEYNTGELPPATVEILDDYYRMEDDSIAWREPVLCQPMPDPFLPCDDLFGWWYLRCGVWVVLQLALLGNSVVLFVSITSKSKMDVQRFLICNLATADLFMGLYLGFLAVVDAGTLGGERNRKEWAYQLLLLSCESDDSGVGTSFPDVFLVRNLSGKTSGEFKKFALDWQTSPWCQVAGILGTVSSEMSVYTLTIITLERFYVITHTMQLDKRLSLRRAGYIMLTGWIFTITLATMPLFGISNYQKFAICLPFETGDMLSLVYVCFIMTFNATSFLVIMSCYLKMYCDIRDSQAWNSPDVRVAKRMSLLIFTDFLCWMPITILSLTAMFGKELISLEEAKFFTIFVLPLNSCANPFLYAIFTKQFKRDCANFCRRLEESTINQGYGRHGTRHQQASWGSGRLASLLKLFWVDKRQDSEHPVSSKCSINIAKGNNFENLTKKCYCPVCEECIKLQLAEEIKTSGEMQSGQQIISHSGFAGRKADSDDRMVCCYKETPENAVSGSCNSPSCSTEDERLLNRVHLFQQPCSHSDEPGTVMIPLEILHVSSEIPSTSRDDCLSSGICTGSSCAAVAIGVNGAASSGSCTGSNNNSNGNNGGCVSVSDSGIESQYLSFCSGSNGANGGNGGAASVLISGGANNGGCQVRFTTNIRDIKNQKRGINNDTYKLNPRRGCPQSCHHTVYSPKWAPAHQRLKSKSGLSIVPEEEKQDSMIPRVKITHADDNDIEHGEVVTTSTTGSPVMLRKALLPHFTQRQDGYSLLSTTADFSYLDNNGDTSREPAIAMVSFSQKLNPGRDVDDGAVVTQDNEDIDDDEIEHEAKNVRHDFHNCETNDLKTSCHSLQASPRYRGHCKQRSVSMSTLKGTAPGRDVQGETNMMQSLRPYRSAETVKADRCSRLSPSSLTVPSKVTRRIPSLHDNSLSCRSTRQTTKQ